MRLDHLLSKEEEVEEVCFTVWLSRSECTDGSANGQRENEVLRMDMSTDRCIRGIDSTEKTQSGFEARKDRHVRQLNSRKLLVAMRLGETPVPIPNTTVKT